MDKVKSFLLEVSKLANEYDLDIFCVSEGASITRIKHNTEPVREARNNHILWEIENGMDYKYDWNME